MSMQPWFRTPYEDYGWPSMPVTPFDSMDMSRTMRNMENNMRRMMKQFNNQWPERIETGLSEVINDDRKFQVNLDVKHFKPEELEVKTAENRLIIHGKHEEKPDQHGYIRREFTRSYWLPKGVDPQSVKSNLTAEGQLTIMAPKRAIEGAKEHKIPIQH